LKLIIIRMMTLKESVRSLDLNQVILKGKLLINKKISLIVS
jgi:hypothetical protein